MQRSRFVVILSLLLTVALSVAFLPTIIVRAEPFTFDFTGSDVNVLNDNTDTATITVHATDDGNAGANVPDGTTINFAVSPSAGVTLSAASATTTGGIAGITLTADSTVAAGTSLTVTASITDGALCTTTCEATFNITVLGAALPNQGQSTIAAVPTSIAADGTATSVVTVTLKNAAGTPIQGVTLTLTPDVAGPNVVANGGGTTDVNGVATFNVTWVNVDLAAPQSINFVTGAINGDAGSTFTLTTPIQFTTPNIPAQGPTTLVAVPTSVLANGTSASVVTATLLNAAGAPVAGKTVSLVQTTGLSGIGILPTPTLVTDVNGVATFNVTGTVVGSATFQLSDTTDTIDFPSDLVTITFVSTLPNEGPSSVTAVPTSVPADNATTSTITVTLLTALNTPVQGKSVTLTQTTPLGGVTIAPAIPVVTDVNGVAVFTVRGSTPGSATFRATDTTDGVDLINDPVTVTFTTPAANKTNSTVTTDKTVALANNSDTATITVTLRDGANNLLPGKSVNLQTNLAPSGIFVNNQAFPWAPVTTNASGVAVFTVKSNTPYTGGISFTAIDITDGNLLLNDPADVITITFTSPPADKTQTQVSADRSSVFANGTDSATITVIVRDAAGFPIPDKSVAVFSVSNPSGVTINGIAAPGAAVNTNGNGVATFVVRSTTVAASVNFVFRVNSDNLLLDDAADIPIISFVAPVPTNTATNTPTLTPTGPTPTPTALPGTSAALSTVSCDYSQAPADGVFKVTISITLRDQNNQPVPNHLPIPSVIPPTAGLSFSSPALTDVSGRVTYYVSSVTQTAPNSIVISVTDATAQPNVILAQTCTIIFAAPGSTPVVGPTPIGGLTLTPIGGTITVTPSRTQAGLLNAADQGPITGIVVAYRLRVRTGPGLNYEILGLLRYKVTIVLLGRNRAGTWLLTQLDDGRQVWVSSRWIKISRARFRRLELIDVPPRTPLSPAATPTVRPIVNPAPSSFIVPSSGQGAGTANVPMLNAYAAPSSDASVVDVLPYGTEMLILGKSKDGNWYYVESRATRGWVPATYVSVSKITGETLGVVNLASTS